MQLPGATSAWERDGAVEDLVHIAEAADVLGFDYLTCPEHTGEFYSYDSVVMDPCAVQSHVPIWVGGRSRRSLRRAVTLADGWMPFGISATRAAEMLSTVDLPPGFEIALPCGQLAALRDISDETQGRTS